MASRTIRQLIPALAVSEGAGVTVRRTLGTPALRNLDPFLMLDHFGSDNPNEYIAGFPDHPHRGFVTLTYMLDGHMLHRDSMGNQGDLRAGGAQWMKAASGVIHSEMPQQTSGLMRGFQLWINLPASQKMSDPAYQEFSPEAFPVVDEGDVRVKIICGEYGGKTGPIVDDNTRVRYYDVALSSNAEFHLQLEAGANAFLYPYDGGVMIGGKEVPAHHLAVFSAGDEMRVSALANPARFVLVSGVPIREPIVQYGPFVMNTREEIEQAFDDYRAGKLVQKKAAWLGGG